MSESRLIYICYALITEEKNNLLKMQGPYIHSRPKQSCEYEDEEELFVFEDNEFSKERRFLSRFLREKHPDKLSIFHKVAVDSVSNIGITCRNCSAKTLLPDGFHKPKWCCPNCDTINEIENFSELNLKIRQCGMMNAQEFFDKRFNQMHENYTICNRTRKKKK